jgi:hypothetical protein
MSLQRKYNRNQVSTQSEQHKFSDEFHCLENEKKKSVEAHWWKVILEWVNVAEKDNPLADHATLKLPIIGCVCQSTINKWTADLVAVGYVIEIEGNLFVIS